MSLKVIQAGLLVFIMVMIMGCSEREDRTEKLRDLEFTVLSEEQLPEELRSIMEEKKAESFKLSFADENDLYICVGYGRQPTGGYSISVTELYETGNAVYVHTNLLGPSPDEAKTESPSYPYIVIKLEKMDKKVVFE